MKTILKIFITVFSLAPTIQGLAQNSIGKTDDLERISLTPVVADLNEDIPMATYSLLQNKLQQIATNNGLGGNAYSPRFVITCNLNVMTKDVLPGPPPMIAMNIDATFYIVDYVSQTVFSTTTVSVKAVGTNLEKSYINGIRNINPRSPEMKSFVGAGKNKIIAYYNDRCDYILQEAKSLASQKRYREAIFQLSSVPEVCKDCYFQATDAIEPIFQAYLNDLCERNLSAATAVWIANPNSYGANEVIGYLSEILPDAACFGEAQNLVSEIRSKILADEKRDWNFQLKQWNDRVSLESQRIKAYRDVGVAYGQNQPNNTYHFKGWLW